ncbi:accessory factor UbiK family protein [Porticoccus sp.]
MKPDELLNLFLQQLNSVITPGAEMLGTELQQKIRAAAQATFDKLDLVTRDEFDAQRAVLTRSREKLEQLEKQLAELEARIADQQV